MDRGNRWILEQSGPQLGVRWRWSSAASLWQFFDDCDQLLNDLAELGAISAITFDLRGLNNLPTTFPDEASRRRLFARLRPVQDRLAKLDAVTYAILDGPIRDLGLAMALACDYRFALRQPATSLAIPGIRFGHLPVGLIRPLTALLGPRRTRGLLEADGPVGVETMHRLGLVDAVLNPARRSSELAEAIDARGRKPRRRSFLRRLRDLVASAPVGVATANLDDDVSQSLSRLRSAATQLSSAEYDIRERREAEALALRPAYAIGLALQNPAPADGMGAGSGSDPLPRRIGLTGPLERTLPLAVEFAAWQVDVLLMHGESPATFDRLTQTLPAAIRQQICPTATGEGFTHADLVLVAGDDEIGRLRQTVDDLERIVHPRVPIGIVGRVASIEQLQSTAGQPQRFFGVQLHERRAGTRVAEIATASQTSEATIRSVESWFRAWDCMPLSVADRPGRLIDLVRFEWLDEAVNLVAEGLAPHEIDRACRRFGFEESPLKMCDRSGFREMAEAVEAMRDARGDDFGRQLSFDRLREFGLAGTASGEGFYRNGKSNDIARMILWRDQDDDHQAHYYRVPAEAVREGIERLVLRTINAAAECLANEPDADPATVDRALVFGMGWCPPLGGPLRHADTLGLSYVVQRLEYLAERFGPRFRPCDELLRRADAGEGFFTEGIMPGVETVSPTRVAA
jgi:3-hydroxyacyl-CoA dehydrogenase / enoyl-CoA hydratase / 3-hydroxybutyryl-CoA epimerase